MNDLEYGDRVTITNKFSRIHSNGYNKWIPIKLLDPVEGCVYLGRRKLANGKIYYDSGATMLTDRKYLWAGLVSVNHYTNPIYVPPEYIFK